MLGKLMKYDLKSMFKTMLPLWIALVVASILFSIRLVFFSGGEGSAFVSSQGNVSLVIMGMVLFGVFAAVFVLNIIVVIQRFWNGLLKDEGYLMFTLPVSSRSLIISKALSAVIITAISTLVTVICIALFLGFGFVGYAANGSGLHELIEGLNQAWQVIGQTFARNPLRSTGWILFWFLTGITEILEHIYHAYLAMAFGQLSNKNRFLMSILAYLGISVVISTVVLAPLGAMGLLTATAAAGPAWMFSASGGPSFTVLAAGLVCNILQVLLYHVVTELLLTKKLNLE